MNHRAGKSFGGSVGAVVVTVILGSAAVSMPARAAGPQVGAPRAATTSFNFDNIPVRSALQLIAEEGDFNLVVSDSVTGTISLHLEDVTWEQALDIVLRMKGLGMRIDGNTRAVAVSGR